MKEYFKFPNRDLVNSNSWEKLMTLLQCDDYHCIFTNQRYNPKTNSFELNPNALPFEYTEDGGIVIKNNKEQVEFEIHPFYWGNCTCGVDEESEHKETCLLLRHNFRYHPNQEDEFWIDWYKYPFRSANISTEKTESEILEIFDKCCEIVEKLLKERC